MKKDLTEKSLLAILKEVQKPEKPLFIRPTIVIYDDIVDKPFTKKQRRLMDKWYKELQRVKKLR